MSPQDRYKDAVAAVRQRLEERGEAVPTGLPIGTPVFTAPEPATELDRSRMIGRRFSKKGFMEGVAEGGVIEVLPYLNILGSFDSGARGLRRDYDAVTDGTANQEQFMRVLDDQIDRGKPGSTLYHAARVIKQTIPFGLEIMTTGGWYTAGRVATMKGFGKLVGHGVKKGLARKAAGFVGGVATQQAAIGSAKAAITKMSDADVWGGPDDAEAMRRAVPEFGLDASDDGRLQLVMKKVGAEIGDKKYAARMSNFYELGTERLGPTLSKLLQKLPAGRQVVLLEQALFKWMRGKGYGKNMDELLALTGNKAQIHSVLEEFLEEGAADIVKGMTPGMEDQVGDSLQSFEQVAGMFLGLAAPGAARAGLARAAGPSGAELEKTLKKVKTRQRLEKILQTARTPSPEATNPAEAEARVDEAFLQVEQDTGTKLERAELPDTPAAKDLQDRALVSGIDVAPFSVPPIEGEDLTEDFGEGAVEGFYPAEGLVMVDIGKLDQPGYVDAVFAHEAFHDMGAKRRELLDETIKLVANWDPVGLDQRIAEAVAGREAIGRPISPGLVAEEGTATYVQRVNGLVRYLMSPKGKEFLGQLYGKDKGLVAKIAQAVRDLLARVGIKLKGKDQRLLEQLAGELGETVTLEEVQAADVIARAFEAVHAAAYPAPSARPTVVRPAAEDVAEAPAASFEPGELSPEDQALVERARRGGAARAPESASKATETKRTTGSALTAKQQKRQRQKALRAEKRARAAREAGEVQTAGEIERSIPKTPTELPERPAGETAAERAARMFEEGEEDPSRYATKKPWDLPRFKAGDRVRSQPGGMTGTVVKVPKDRQEARARGYLVEWDNPRFGATQSRVFASNMVPLEAEEPPSRYAVAPATNTPAFKTWFKSSKAVDESGDPLVVTHITSFGKRDWHNEDWTKNTPYEVKPFTEFKPGGIHPELSGPGIWLAPSPENMNAAHNVKGDLKGAAVYPLYTSIQNPLYVDNVEDVEHRDWLRSMYGNEFPLLLSPEAVAEIKKDGYDGIFLTREGVPEEIIAFDPTQVKSAIGNRGTYDPTNPDIRYATAPARDSEAFKEWFGRSKVRNFDRTPKVVYRGTQRPGEATKGIGIPPSFTDFPDIASTYAATPGDIWSSRPATYGRGASVAPVYLSIQNPLYLGEEAPEFLFSEYLEHMQFGEERGMTEEEAMKALNYLVNRERGKTKSKGEFRHELPDEYDPGFSFTATPLSEYRDAFEYDGDRIADDMMVDVFVLADAPVTRRVAKRLGYDGIIHLDVFAGRHDAAALIGKSPKEVEGLEEWISSYRDMDLEDTHYTYRPFFPTQIKSATGNRGTYDPTNPDIRYAIRPEDFEAGINPVPVPGDPKARVQRTLKRKKGVGAQRNPRTRIALPDQPDFVLGKITTADWLRRVEGTLTPEEIERARSWYPDANSFFSETGSEWPKFVTAWLIANKNVDVTGATLNALRGREHLMSPPAELGTAASPKAGLSEQSMAAFWAWAEGRTDELEDVEVGQKLFDFIDSALGKKTRTWMGDDPRLGEPFVVDVHSARDMGYVDPAMINYLRDKGAKEEQLEGLEVDLTGAPSETQYERAAARGRDVAAYLNRKGFMGGEWNAASVQAVGWITMQKATGRAMGFPDLTLPKLTREITAAAIFGEGAPLNETFPELAELPYEGQLRVTERAIDRALEAVNPLVGDLPVLGISYGGGGFLTFPVEPSAAIRVAGSPEGVQSLSSALAYVLQQTSVRSERPLELTASEALPGAANAWLVDIRAPELASSEEARQRFWDALMAKTDTLKGFHPTAEGIRIGIDTSGEYAQKEFRGLKKGLPKLQTLVDNTVDTVLAEVGITARVSVGPAQVETSHHDWTEEKEGRGHLGGLVARWGPAVQGDLDRARGAVEAEIGAALEAEEVAKPEPVGAGEQRFAVRPPSPVVARAGVKQEGEVEGEANVAADPALKLNVPDEDIPGLDYRDSLNELFLDWISQRDLAVEWAEKEAARNERELLDALPKRAKAEILKTAAKTGDMTDPRARQLDDAMELYIDLIDKGEVELAKFGESMDETQRELYELSQNLPPKVKALGDRINRENRERGKMLKEAEVIESVLENYTKRKWKQEDEDPNRPIGVGVAAFKTNSESAKHRTLSSILHGWSLGKELAITGAIGAQRAHRIETARVLHDRNLLKVGEKAGVISPAQQDKWLEVDHPNFKRSVVIGKAAWDETKQEFTQVYGNNQWVDEEGNIWQRTPLYAPPHLAKKLNNVFGKSWFADKPFWAAVARWNAILKATVLFTSLFHHQAYLRSYMYGTPFEGKGFVGGAKQALNWKQAYKDGQDAIDQWGPLVRELVGAGLTLRRDRDIDEIALREKTKIGEWIDKVPGAREAKNTIVALRDQQTNFLFHRMGPHFKVQSALLEYRHLLKVHEQAIIDGTVTRKQVAKIAADTANDDFGGLNLSREHRSKTQQQILRFVLLAPDWTESNVRSMMGFFGAGDPGGLKGDKAKAYRALWTRVAVRAMGATILFNLLMSGMDDDDRDPDGATFWTRYKRAFDEGNMRWLDVDITPLYNAAGGTSPRRKYFSILGHFRDPLKFVLHPFRSIKHKASILSGMVIESLEGADWAGRPFTNWQEYVGVDDKGEYKTSRRNEDGTWDYRQGDPKGGRIAGETVSWKSSERRGPIDWQQIPSYVINQTRGSMPIQVQNATGFLAGEMDAWDAITKSLGLMTATTREKTYDSRLSALQKELKETKDRDERRRIRQEITKLNKWAARVRRDGGNP